MSKQSEEQQHSSQASAEMYSLSSILSDYKAGAFVRNEKKMNKKELEQKAEEIIAEMRRELSGSDENPTESGEETSEDTGTGVPAPFSKDESNASEEAAVIADELINPVESEETAESETETEPEEIGSETITMDPEYGTRSPLPELKPLKTKWLQKQEKRRQRAIQRYEKKRAAIAAEAAEDVVDEEQDISAQQESEKPVDSEASEPDAVTEHEHNPESELHQDQKKKERVKKPEPTRDEAIATVSGNLKSISRRLPIAFLFSFSMAFLTMVSEGSTLNLPTGDNMSLLPIILVVLQLCVMVLGLDIMARGISDLISLRPGYESLVAIANVAVVADAALKATDDAHSGNAFYCVCAAVALTFTLWGARMRNAAYRDTLKTMGLASVPTVVTAEEGLIEGGTVLAKRLDGSKGFIRRLLKSDMPDRVYHKITPFLLVLLLILAGAAAYLSGSGEFMYSLAALTCAAAGLAAPMVFARPFAALSKKLSGNGAAVAGWSGASEMEQAKGIIIRDLDIFPENCIYQNAMRVLSGAMAERVVAYTGSVIIAAGSGLKRAFGELMRQYNAPLYHVEDFECGTEGGISAFIGQEQVLVGSSAFMNLLGIRVPSNVDMAGAVYTAIDNELCGVFVIQYTPSAMVQNALLRLSDSTLRPIFAIRDFNISPAMMQQKFRIDSALSFLPVENRYFLSRELDSHHAPAALLSRDGLWHYSETAHGSRRMIHMVRRALAMTLLGAALGIIIVFIALSKGAFAAAAPLKLLSSMILWAIATMLISDCADSK